MLSRALTNPTGRLPSIGVTETPNRVSRSAVGNSVAPTNSTRPRIFAPGVRLSMRPRTSDSPIGTVCFAQSTGSVGVGGGAPTPPVDVIKPPPPPKLITVVIADGPATGRGTRDATSVCGPGGTPKNWKLPSGPLTVVAASRP